MSAKLKLKVEGLECAGCALDLETILLRMDGILKAKVDYAENNLTIEYDPAETDEKQILSAIMRMKLTPANR